MAPRPPLPAAADALNGLISSTTYPHPPSIETLGNIRKELSIRRRSTRNTLKELDPAEAQRYADEREKRKLRPSASAGGAPSDTKDLDRGARDASERRGKDEQAGKHGNGGGHAPLARAGSASAAAFKVKRERMSTSPAPSNASIGSGRPTGQPTTYSSQNKKKRPRIVDSEDEAPRATPTSPTSHNATSGLKVRLGNNQYTNAKSRATPAPSEAATPISGPSAALSASIDFSLPTPAQRPLVPVRPPVPAPPKPGPKRQSEVNEDFSNVKAPSQIMLATFWNSVEPYLRDIREEDIATLGFKADAPESFAVPPKGRHYTEVWDEEDGNPPGTTPRVSVPNIRLLNANPSAAGAAAASAGGAADWVPGEMTDFSLLEEMRGLGAISERLVAAVLPESGAEVSARGEAVRGKPADDWEAHEAVRVNAQELEARLKKELRDVMLLGEHEEYDPAKRDDDEVASALRQCQRLLAAQIGLNEERKLRLAERAKYRVAYAEYTSALEGVEKSIENGWAKRVKKHGSKKGTAASAAGGAGGRPPVSDGLKRLVQVRKGWIETVGKRMRERPVGEVRGLPGSSIYEGIAGMGGGDGERDGEDDVHGGGSGAEHGGEGGGDEERAEEEEVQAALGMELD